MGVFYKSRKFRGENKSTLLRLYACLSCHISVDCCLFYSQGNTRAPLITKALLSSATVATTPPNTKSSTEPAPNSPKNPNNDLFTFPPSPQEAGRFFGGDISNPQACPVGCSVLVRLTGCAGSVTGRSGIVCLQCMEEYGLPGTIRVVSGSFLPPVSGFTPDFPCFFPACG